MNRNAARFALVAALTFTASGPAAGATLFGPTPYSSLADSPFNGLTFEYFHLDNFESARTPGYTATTGGVVLGPSSFTDSVDLDDGVSDGLGIAGSSWFSNGATGVFTFTFDAATLGSLPTHAGIVWTDVGDVTAGTSGTSAVLFEAFGSGGESLGPPDAFLLGEGNALGGTSEDRFFGAYNPGGISSIAISMPASVDWEVDHLQYGALAPIPEPGQWLLMALGVGAVGWRARSKARLR